MTEHPALVNAREAVELKTEFLALQDSLRDRRLTRAVLLAPSLEICEALLRGERVPVSRLDPRWVKRYGLR